MRPHQVCPCPHPQIGLLCAPIYSKWEWAIALDNLLDTQVGLAVPSLGVFTRWAGAPPSRMYQALTELNTAEK